jgi:hypothetical protein
VADASAQALDDALSSAGVSTDCQAMSHPWNNTCAIFGLVGDQLTKPKT